MKRVLMLSLLTAGALSLLWFASATDSLGAGQRGGPEASGDSEPGPTPRMADGRPDLSGVWWGGADVGGRGFGRVGDAPTERYESLFQPSVAARAETLSDKDDPTLRCIPTAFGTMNVRLWDVGGLGQIVSTPEFVVLLSETYHGFQLIPTDGREHRDFVPPSYRGDAVGHWEDDTFVVETTNFTDDTWMFAEGRVSLHSDALRIVERYNRPDANTLTIDATIEDPEALTGPWVVPTQTLELAPFDQIMPLNCIGTETTALMEAAQQNQ